jgi:hypothetical protein
MMSGAWRHDFVPIKSLTGVFLDALGGLYLAYDLLGGSRGPLRTINQERQLWGDFWNCLWTPARDAVRSGWLTRLRPLPLSLEIGHRNVRKAHPFFEAMAFG